MASHESERDDALLEAAYEETFGDGSTTVDAETKAEDGVLKDAIITDDEITSMMMEKRDAVMAKLAIARRACIDPMTDPTSLATPNKRYDSRKDLLRDWFLLNRLYLKPETRLPPVADFTPPPQLIPYICPVSMCLETDWWLTDKGFSISGPTLCHLIQYSSPLKDPVGNLPIVSVVYNVEKSILAKDAIKAFQIEAGSAIYNRNPKNVLPPNKRLVHAREFVRMKPSCTETNNFSDAVARHASLVVADTTLPTEAVAVFEDDAAPEAPAEPAPPQQEPVNEFLGAVEEIIGPRAEGGPGFGAVLQNLVNDDEGGDVNQFLQMAARLMRNA